MSKPKIHWRPDYPISYPSGPRTMRTFVLRGNIVCSAGQGGCGDWSAVTKWVTCKNCLRIAGMHRRDSDETIEKVLRRPDVETPSGRLDHK